MIKNNKIFMQEEEFLKLNSEIDSKTKNLLIQMDQIKKIQLKNDEFYSNLSLAVQDSQLLGSGFAENEDEQTFLSNLQEDCSKDLFFNEFNQLRNNSSNLLKKYELSEEHLDKDKIEENRKYDYSSKATASLGGECLKSQLSLIATTYKSVGKLAEEKPENDLPRTLKEISNDGIISFLSAKVKLLSAQLEAVQKDERKHIDKIKELQTVKNKSVEERDKLLQQAHTSKSFLAKYEKHVENMSSQMQCALTENTLLKKELESLKKELRNNNKNHTLNEMKLNKALEEIEGLRMVIQRLKRAEKEDEQFQRKKTDFLTNTIRSLDRQRAELLIGFKKQLVLIDNLKRQKGLIDVAKFLKTTEDDMTNYLDCNPRNAISHADFVKFK